MPAKKKPKKSDGQTIDIKPLAEARPSATSRPIIVKNRSLGRDPMLAESTEPAAESGGQPLLSSHGRTIMPLSPSEKSEISEAASEPVDKPAPTADELVSKLKAKKAAAEKSDGSDKPSSEDVTSEAAGAPTLDKDKAADIMPEAASEASEDSEEEKKGADGTDVSEETAADEPAAPDKKEAEQPADPKKSEADAEAAAKRQAELDELVASGQYFVPVNQARKRQGRRLLVALIIILLIIIAVDLLYDSGVLKSSGFTFHTHFFQR